MGRIPELQVTLFPIEILSSTTVAIERGISTQKRKMPGKMPGGKCPDCIISVQLDTYPIGQPFEVLLSIFPIHLEDAENLARFYFLKYHRGLLLAQ